MIANTASGGAAGSGGVVGQGVGGGVYNKRGVFTFDAITMIIANSASTSNSNIFSI